MNTTILEGEVMQATGTSIVPTVETFITKDILDRTRERLKTLDIRESTTKDYLYRVPKFEEFLKELAWNKETEKLETPLLAYKKHLEADPSIKITTKNKFFTSAKLYCQALRKEIERTYRTPLNDLTVDGAGRPVKGFAQGFEHRKTGVSADELEVIADYLYNMENTSRNIRTRAIFSLLIYHGLRQIEIVRLDVEDVHLGEGVMYLLRKGKTEKTPWPMRPQAVKAIAEYLEDSGKKSGPLFTNDSSNGNNERLSTRSIQNIVGKVLDELDIKKTTHGFRHWMTTAALKKHKGELDTVAELTGHQNLNMLKIYNDELNSFEAVERTADVFENIKIGSAKNDYGKVEKMIQKNRFVY